MDEETRRVMEAGFATLADLIRETNAELGELRGELGEVRGDLGEVRGDLGELREEVAKTNGRLDNLIVIAGEHARDLRQDLDSLAARVEALEKKAS